MHGEDAALQVHQFFNGRAALGFHRECQVWKRGDLLEKVRPAIGRMLESEIGHRFARRINDDDFVLTISQNLRTPRKFFLVVLVLALVLDWVSGLDYEDEDEDDSVAAAPR